MELLDIVDENGNPTGETIPRNRAHREGFRHRTAHVWIVRRKETGFQVLLQKRALCKDSFPGCYDTSSAGHIMAGDEPTESAVRELSEELGLQLRPEDLKFAGIHRANLQVMMGNAMWYDDEVAFIHVYDGPVEISELTFQEEEVMGADWFDLSEAMQKVIDEDPGFCMDIGCMETLKAWLYSTEK